MEKCQTCVHFQNFLFSRPVCRRISNVDLKTRTNRPLKVYEAFRICKGYFYEHRKDAEVKENSECSGSDT